MELFFYVSKDLNAIEQELINDITGLRWRHLYPEDHLVASVLFSARENMTACNRREGGERSVNGFIVRPTL